MTHLVFIAPLPPPLHGAARSSRNVLDRLLQRTEGHDIVAIRTSGGALETTSPLYHLRRVAGYARAAAALIRGRRHPARACYMCAAAGYGILYDIVLVAIARLLGTPVFLHHRSFRYIDRPSRLMALETSLGGTRMTHVFLCETMASIFMRRYPAATRHLIVSNAFYNPPAPAPQEREPRTPLRIGLLSNLCHEKGLTDFLDLLEKGLAEGLPLYGILAGAPFYPAARRTIEDALARLPGKLEWRGPITDEGAKEEFFRDIDVFIFPTRYANEAQPIVVFESLSRGLPTIAFNRGCIPSDLDESCGLVVAGGDDFTMKALPLLKDLLEKPELWHKLSRAGIARVAASHEGATRQFEALAHALLTNSGIK